jgi:hypothetical protein
MVVRSEGLKLLSSCQIVKNVTNIDFRTAQWPRRKGGAEIVTVDAPFTSFSPGRLQRGGAAEYVTSCSKVREQRFESGVA